MLSLPTSRPCLQAMHRPWLSSPSCKPSSMRCSPSLGGAHGWHKGSSNLALIIKAVFDAACLILSVEIPAAAPIITILAPIIDNLLTQYLMHKKLCVVRRKVLQGPPVLVVRKRLQVAIVKALGKVAQRRPQDADGPTDEQVQAAIAALQQVATDQTATDAGIVAVASPRPSSKLIRRR